MVWKHIGMTPNERLYYNLLDRRYAIHNVFDTFGVRQRRFLELGEETWLTHTT